MITLMDVDLFPPLPLYYEEAVQYHDSTIDIIKYILYIHIVLYIYRICYTLTSG